MSLLANRARLLIACPDRPGIVAAVSQFLFEHGANIVHSDQHTTDPEGGAFFMRVEFDILGLKERVGALESEFGTIAERFEMEWRVACASPPKRLAIFVTKEDHCLQELLWRARSGDLRAEIALVVGNHRDLEHAVTAWGMPFLYVPVINDRKREAEQIQHQALERERIDLVVLARYMQILSGEFVKRWPNGIINIHHSFLPAFVGAKPYDQAHSRGVKLIGATAHYVTEDLDAGPIVEQGVERVDHRQNVDDLKRIGRYIERVVLARAVSWHVEDRVLVHQNRTVVFA